VSTLPADLAEDDGLARGWRASHCARSVLGLSVRLVRGPERGRDGRPSPEAGAVEHPPLLFGSLTRGLSANGRHYLDMQGRCCEGVSGVLPGHRGLPGLRASW
jgi:hypothetical protein